MRRRADGGIVRIAHRGATAFAPDNSREALIAALALDVDYVEIDVSEVAGGLVLAHSQDVAAADAPSLEEALELFVAHARPETGLHLDLKPRRGAETGVVDAVRRAGLVGRTFVTSTFAPVLAELRRLEPALDLGLGYPFDRGGVAEKGLLPEAFIRAALLSLRVVLPYRVAGMLGRAAADTASLHHLVITPAAVRRVHDRGAVAIAWTVNDRADLVRVVRAGVDGVVTDDPTVFDGPGTAIPR